MIGERASAQGILNCAERGFGEVLADELAGLMAGVGAGAGAGGRGDGDRLPVVMSGMIGSRQGWREAAYLRCPAAPGDIAEALIAVETDEAALAGYDIRIVPGMDTEGAGGGAGPDVMRGEETQVLGAMIIGAIRDGVFVIPGTHSKRIVVEGGRITEFFTFMTGELFAALLDGTILGRLAQGRETDGDGFRRGVAAAQAAARAGAGPGDLMNLIFSARTRVLTGGLDEAQVAGYLSGLLVGAELMSHARAAKGAMWLIAEGELAARYQDAARLAGVTLERVEGEIVAAAHRAIARQAGMVRPGPVGDGA